MLRLYWVFAFGIAIAERLLPLKWWLHGPLTVAALASLPLFAFRVGTLLRGDDGDEGSPRRFDPWTLVSFVSLCLVFAVSELAKLWLIRELWRGQSPDGLIRGYRSYIVVALVVNVLVLSMRRRPMHRLLIALAERTARLAAVSFVKVILIGAFLLMLPVSVRNASDISAIDALFTSASAVCVTGLAVNQISETYTFFGQAVLLLLIQIGGLGIMVLYGAAAALAGRRMSTKNARMLSEIVDITSLSRVRKLLFGIIGFTLVVELIGTIALYNTFRPYPQTAFGPEVNLPLAGAGSLLWASVFHSVSAFCNAGFSLFRSGISPFAADWAVSWTLMILVIIGGLGFPVCFELIGRVKTRLGGKRPERLSVHSRIVLSMSAFLLVFGTVMYLVLEWTNSMQGLPLHAKLLTAAFQSTIARTAGFNTLDYSKMASATWLFTCVLMFIGASPGSTGGGIKTTTFAVLMAATRADLKGQSRIEMWRRSVNDETVRKAVGVTLISSMVVVFITFLALMTERFDPLQLVFETVSALATVGLSTGITKELSDAGKLILTVAMYLGRIGPLTLAAALASNKIQRSISLPEERIGIG
jgi:trk system potassium uptake protein TrkH